MNWDYFRDKFWEMGFSKTGTSWAIEKNDMPIKSSIEASVFFIGRMII
jgi:hypothetical protein